MSCVSAIAQNDKIYMACDYYSITESFSKRYRKDCKIFQNGPYLIGFAGEIRGGQMLRPEFWKPPKDLIYFGEAVRDQFNEKGCCQKSAEGTDETGTGFIVGWKGQLIQITSDFQTAEHTDNFTAMGTGGDYALSILFYTRKQLDPVKRLKEAQDCAAYFSAGVSKEHRIFILEKDKVREITNGK